MLEGEVLVLDMGAYTLDALKMVNGNFNPEELEHATFENGGIMVHILEPILRTLKRMGDDFSLLSIEDAERVLRLGLISGDYTLTVAGQASGCGATGEQVPRALCRVDRQQHHRWRLLGLARHQERHPGGRWGAHRRRLHDRVVR